jgi:formylglycine-generating enzyme required for sulfatase activity
VRGGAWRSAETGVRCAYRSRFAPYLRNHVSGFRVVVSPGS